MNVFLVENQSSPVFFRQPQQWEVDDLDSNPFCKGSIELVIKCSDLSSKGRGVNSKKKFPWTSSVSSLSERLRGRNNCFSFRASFILVNYNDENGGYGRLPPKMKVKLEGDFLEVMKFVFNQVPKEMKMNFDAVFKFGHQLHLTSTLHQEMDGTDMDGGDVIFESCPELHPDFARQISRALDLDRSDRSVAVAVTMELIGVDSDGGTNDAAGGLGNPVTKKILEEADNGGGDFELVSEDGKRFRAHKMFLEAATPFFKRMFETDCKEMEENACKLQLTDEAVMILREFIYSGSVGSLEEKPEVMMELLEAAHSMEITSLEEALKQLILKKRDNWLDFNGGLQLFVKAVQWGEGYEGIKIKAARAIKMTPEEIKTSPECEALFKSDWETARELFFYCSQNFPDLKGDTGKGDASKKKKTESSQRSPRFSPVATNSDMDGEPDWEDAYNIDDDDDDVDDDYFDRW